MRQTRAAKMLYGKQIAEEHTAALDALESCLSASHVDVRGAYRLRLDAHKPALLEILDFFDKDEQIYEHTELMRLLVDMFDGKYFTGFQINAHERLISMCRKRIKGKLMFTRTILQDKDKKPACLDKAHHRQVCKCANLAKETMAQ
jgi:hypothetical protein